MWPSIPAVPAFPHSNVAPPERHLPTADYYCYSNDSAGSEKPPWVQVARPDTCIEGNCKPSVAGEADVHCENSTLQAEGAEAHQRAQRTRKKTSALAFQVVNEKKFNVK